MYSKLFYQAALLVLLVLIVLVFALTGAPRAAQLRARVTGVWVGDSEFLLKGGLSDFYVYFAPARDGERDRHGYVVAVGDDGSAASQPFTFAPANLFGSWWCGAQAHFGKTLRAPARVSHHAAAP